MSLAPVETIDGPLGRVLAAAGRQRQRAGKGWLVLCPAHGDRSPSLSVTTGDDGRVLLRCHAGCEASAIVAAWGLTMADLFPERANGRCADNKSAASADGITLDGLCAAKRLDRPFAARLGWRDAERYGRACVDIVYPTRDGSPSRTRIRIGLTGQRFAWAAGDDPIVAYEPDRGALAREERYVIIVEGETDTVTLLQAGFPALGVPGATSASRYVEAHHVDGIERVYISREADHAGPTFVAGVRARLTELGYSGQVHELPMPDAAKDPNVLWQRDPDAFAAKLTEAMRAAAEPPKPQPHPGFAWLGTQEIFAPLPPTKWVVGGVQLSPGRPAMLAGYGARGNLAWHDSGVALP